MRARLFALSFAAAISFGHAAAADASRRVWRVDSASAIVAGGHLVISANGAVKSGGWDRPKLLVLEPSAQEARMLKIQFVARPPAPKEVVVQQLLPIAARKAVRLPSTATTKVEIVAETNSLIVEVTQ